MTTVDAAIIKHITRGNLTGSGSNASGVTGEVGVTKTYVDAQIATRAPIEHDHNNDYYTKEEVHAEVTKCAPVKHEHNDSYYTKTEVDTKVDENSAAISRDLYMIKQGIDTSKLKYQKVSFGFTEDGHLTMGTYPGLFDLLIFKRKNDETNPWSIYMCVYNDISTSNGIRVETDFLKIYGPSKEKEQSSGFYGIIRFITGTPASTLTSRDGGFDSVMELPVYEDPSTGGMFSYKGDLTLSTLREVLAYALDARITHTEYPSMNWNHWDDKP